VLIIIYLLELLPGGVLYVKERSDQQGIDAIEVRDEEV